MAAGERKEYYTTYEAGNRLFVTHSTIIDWIKRGKLKAAKTLGGHRRILRAELDNFIRRNRMHLGDHEKYKILVADDDASIRVGLKEILEEKGFTVDAAADGFEAGILAIQNSPNLIILDLKMQGLDGFSACRLIKANPLLKHIKILILTGYPSRNNIRKILQFGADRCLAKPVEKRILLKEIEVLLRAKAKKA